MNIKETYKIYKRFKEFSEENLPLLKNNLKELCKEKYYCYGKRGCREAAIQELGIAHPEITLSNFNAITTPSHKGKLTFDNFIIIVNYFNLDLERVFDKTNKITVGTSGTSKKWNDETMSEYVEYYRDNSIEETMKTYKLSKDTAEYYFDKFRKELGEEI